MKKLIKFVVKVAALIVAEKMLESYMEKKTTRRKTIEVVDAVQ
jgi:hypothetical protein